jgi:hypothetical protein
MKRFMFCFAATILFIACSNEKKENTNSEKTEPLSGSVSLPYTASYSSQFNDNVSDSDVLMVLNSYKYWEAGDMKSLAGTLADSVTFLSFDGTRYVGTNAGLGDIFAKHRDSISTVKIEMGAWVKSHSLDKKGDFVNVWYKETDTYKNGKTDSANYMDINGMYKGKIGFYSQYRQSLK